MKFSLRDLLLLTVIVALAVGWWLDHRNLAPDAQVHRENQVRLREFADKVKHGWFGEPGQFPSDAKAPASNSAPNSQSPAPNLSNP